MSDSEQEAEDAPSDSEQEAEDAPLEPNLRVVLLLENGSYRELVGKDRRGLPTLLRLTDEQAIAFMDAINTMDLDYIHETGLDDVAENFGPQLALTESSGTRYWISGDPNNRAGSLRVIEVMVKEMVA